MESVPPPAGSQISRVPAQRTPPDQGAPPPAAPAPAPPRRRLGRVLAIAAAVLAVLCLGGAAVGYVLYDRATAPDRSAPDVVVDNYLRAFLVDRNDTKAALFSCDETKGLASLDGLRQEIQERETDFDVVVRVSWGPLGREKTTNGELVTTTLTIASSSDGQPRSSRREDWQFDVIDDGDGWRVCGASKA